MNDLGNQRLHQFLQEKNSITEGARKAVQDISVQPFHKTWQKVKLANEVNFIREITMLFNNEPAWYAKTVLSEETYQLKRDFFEALADRPIGSFLFSSPDVIRVGLQYSKEKLGSDRFQAFKRHYKLSAEETIWFRQSTFLLCGELLKLQEIFLPNVLETLFTQFD